MSHTLKGKQSEAGFTLVELAVVMIIIGVLIGGILQGQEMITNARTTQTIAQFDSIRAAHNTFFDTYQQNAGDFDDAQNQLTNCAANPCGNGNNDATIDLNVGAAIAVGNEGGFYWAHLQRANLLSGYTARDGGFGDLSPTAPIGGGYMIGDSATGQTGFPNNLTRGIYLVHTRSIADVGADTGALTQQQAGRVDQRLDDGEADTGLVRADANAAANTGCRLVVPGPPVVVSYAGGNTSGSCSLAYRLN